MFDKLILRYSLKQILVASFSILILSTILIGSIVFYNIYQLSNRVHEVATIKQPLMLQAISLSNSIKDSTTSLGLFMLTGKDQHKQSYLKANQAITRDIEKLKKISAAHQYLNPQIISIEKNSLDYLSYQKIFLKLAANPAENFPARAYAAKNMAPYGRAILQNLTQILQSELDNEFTRERQQFYALFSELRYTWSGFVNNVRSYLAYRNESSYAQLMQNKAVIQKLNQQVENYTQLFSLDQEDSYQKILEAQKLLLSNVENLKKLSQDKKWRMDAHLIRTKVQPVLQRINNDIDNIVAHLKEETTTETAVINNTITTTTLSIIGATSFIILMVILIALSSIKIMSKILQMIEHSVLKLSSGDLDFSMSQDMKGDLGDIAAIFNNFSSYLEQTFKNIYATSQQLNNSTQSLSQLTDDTNTDAANQYNETATVSDAMQQMTSTVDEVAQNTSLAAEESLKAATASEQGLQTVTTAAASIHSLANEVQTASHVIDELAGDCDNIGTMLDIIRDISDQTNLLALNAAIEAARAGEQGRGFAVVADEVRTLATRTHDSTEDIQQQISKLQAAAKNAVEVMNKGSNLAQSSVESSKQAGEAFEVINQSISTINTMSKQIASTSEEQNAVTHDMSERISNISQLSTKTTQSSKKSSTASYEIFVLANELHTMISQFTRDANSNTATENEANDSDENDDLF